MIKFKKGSTFSFDAVYEKDKGPDDLSEYQFFSQIRNQTDRLISEVVVTKNSLSTIYNFFVEDTTQWPLGNLYWDISLKDTINDTIVYTKTINITVERSISKWPSES